jgi:hypothetical protein
MNKFVPKIPGKPLLKRRTYEIPNEYTLAYEQAGVTNRDEQIMLFHITQFGGFKINRIPKNMNFQDDFIKKWLKSDYTSGQHHYSANTNFIVNFGNLNIEPLQKIWRQKPLNEEEMFENGFTREEIESSFNFLSELNKFYSTLKLNIAIPNSGISSKDRVQLSRFHGRPYLVKKPKAGGRFFHPETSYQRINSSLRQLITINDEKSCEFDIVAATLQFLNIGLEKKGIGSIAETVLSHQDPFQYFLSVVNSNYFMLTNNERPMDRDDLKLLVYTAMYSTKEKRKFNVSNKLKKMGRSYGYKEFAREFPCFFNTLKNADASFDMPLHMLIYREESRYAQRVLTKGCLEQSIPIIPIHDSFMTPTKNSKSLKSIMEEVSLELYGKILEYKQKY